LINDFPDRLAVIQMHVNYDGYETGWGQWRGDEFYPWVNALLPVLMYDGMWEWPIEDYTYGLLQRLDDPTDVTIDVYGLQINEELWAFTVKVCVEATGAGKEMRIYAAQVLDYWPPASSYARNGLRQVATTRDVEVAAGSCTQIPFTFEFGPESWDDRENIKIIVWAQDAVDQGPAQVHQAAQVTWPFPAPPPPDPYAPRRPQGRVAPYQLPLAVK